MKTKIVSLALQPARPPMAVGAAFCQIGMRKGIFSEAEAGFGLQAVWEIVEWAVELG